MKTIKKTLKFCENARLISYLAVVFLEFHLMTVRWQKAAEKQHVKFYRMLLYFYGFHLIHPRN